MSPRVPSAARAEAAAPEPTAAGGRPRPRWGPRMPGSTSTVCLRVALVDRWLPPCPHQAEDKTPRCTRPLRKPSEGVSTRRMRAEHKQSEPCSHWASPMFCGISTQDSLALQGHTTGRIRTFQCQYPLVPVLLQCLWAPAMLYVPVIPGTAQKRSRSSPDHIPWYNKYR